MTLVFTRRSTIYKTTRADENHPGAPCFTIPHRLAYVGGEVTSSPRIVFSTESENYVSFPSQEIASRSLSAGGVDRRFQTRNLIHQRTVFTGVALEIADGLVIHPLAGMKGTSAETCMKCHEVPDIIHYPTTVIPPVFPGCHVAAP